MDYPEIIRFATYEKRKPKISLSMTGSQMEESSQRIMIIKLGSRCRYVFSYKTPAVLPPDKEYCYPLN
jgi:hypothetical protein